MVDVRALVRAAQAGDGVALERLVGDHLPLVYNVLGRVVGPSDVDDLVQETMLRAVRGLGGLREPERFRSWLVAIAYRRMHEHGRRRVVELPHRFETLDVPDPTADFAERSVAELVLSAQRNELVRATAWLDAGDRQLLALWWQEATGALSRAELADALGIDQPHAAVRLKRMKAQLDLARTLVRALAAAPRCDGLAAVAEGWDGTPTSVWRKRLARHVRDCAACGGRAADLVAPERLLPGLGVLLVPRPLADGVRSLLHTAPAAGSRVLPVAGSAAAAVAAAVLLALVPWSDDTATVTPPPVSAPPSAGPLPSSAAPSALDAVYVSPDGSDEGDGSLARPFATLGRAAGAVRPGGTVALRGGTYRLTEPVVLAASGAADRRITLINYRDEHPVLDAAALPATARAVTQTGAYWTVQGLELRGAPGHGWVCSGCRAMVFRRLAFHDNGRSGLLLRDPGTAGNAVLDSDFYGNTSAGGTAGIGLGLTFGDGAGNVVRGNRFYRNATDGLDLGGFADPVDVDSNWSYRNGNGFTLGGGDSRNPVAHQVRNNAAWDNSGLGFNDEGNPGALRLTHNTAFRNALFGFFLPDAAATAGANAAYANGRDARTNPATRWDTPSPSPTPPTDPTTAEAPRPADGSLPRTTFLVSRTGLGATMTAPRTTP
ncbi:sigma-70 family RNA polymerase sigma factor [Streptomyces sp. TLI_171]|uniref:sigma-70 family RNA polymerase sigma factor n=1 Tax=Streptomyces sp. TLI_171 TaxID=1938859 RepID=UPI000C1A6CEE|nr:sigma-70 family RNA polymerase sigma factor [Streptomyces sp. TLI_171]RKE23031.1 RNA polymerase sigma factor (sigma-70 family) [Streptomyces sp. TLI_171]